MDFQLARQIYGEPWFMDAISFMKYAPILEHFRNGGVVSEQKEESGYFVNLSGEVLGANISAENGDESEEKIIAVTNLKGPITKNGGMSHHGTRQLAQKMLADDKKENVIGHILVTESGGGAVNAIPEMTEALDRLTKPSVNFVDGMRGSAANMIGVHADYSIASRATDWIGSNGTMIELSGFANKSESGDGKRHVRVYADESTHKNIEFEEALNKFNFEPIKEKILNPSNKAALEDIKKQRPNITPRELTGEIFRAEEVLGTQIDSIGPFSTAVEKVKELSNLTNSQMNLQELKNKNPEVFQEAVNEGILQERERCETWMTFIETDAKAVSEGIEKGTPVTMKILAQMQKKGAQNAALEDTKEETTEVIETTSKGKEDKELTDNEKELVEAEVKVFAAAGITKTK